MKTGPLCMFKPLQSKQSNKLLRPYVAFRHVGLKTLVFNALKTEGCSNGYVSKESRTAGTIVDSWVQAKEL